MNSSGQAPAWRPPFTPAQWQELEHQALIFKYLMAGIPVPPDLLVPIRKGLDSMASRFFHHASMGYCSYGKKLDPEPGRCRRTDGKKWRCSKDAYPDSKYCERHMHRGRNRSRKPVEAQSQTLAPSPSSSSSPSSTVTSLAGGGAFNSAPASVSFAGPSLNQLQIDLACHGLSIGDHRFGRRARPEVEEQSWNAMHVQARTAAPPPLQELSHGTFRAAPPPTQAWGCFDYAEPVKQDTQNFRTFFDDWPKARESWSELEDERSGAAAAAAVFPATQLSISIPMASSDFSTASSRSPNDERESLGA